MNGTCRLSRRWHQQFCHSPSFATHQRCIQAWVPVRKHRAGGRGRKVLDFTPTPSEVSELGPKAPVSLRPSLPSRSSPRADKNIIVREYEQFGSDNSTRVRINPGKELKNETSKTWAQIQHLEKQLSALRQGPFGPQSEFMQSLPQDDRERLLKTLADEGILPNAEEDVLDLAELDRMFEEEDDDEIETTQDSLAVTLRIPKAHRAYVNRFNKALEDAQDGNNDVIKNLNLWKWYLRCQQKVPGFVNIISVRVWDFLWKSQIESGIRPKHIVILAQDMLNMRKSLSNQQYLDYVQCLHLNDNAKGALQVWEAQRSQFNKDAELLSAFYTMGIQLYALQGQPMEAQQVCHQALRNGAKPEILVHMISAWANEKSAEAAVKAWAVYLKLRSYLGSEVDSNIYEQVSNIFLDTGHQSMALAVFKDLVAGVRGDAQFNLDKYHGMLGSIDRDQDPAEIEKMVNQVSLATLLVLPQGYNNKYFFASWIKKLIGQKRTDAAAMVVDLMYERNVMPDAIHLNGVIGAWLREGDSESREKAEKMAKDMIRERVRLVQQRTKNRTLKQPGDIFRKVMPFNEVDNIWAKEVRTDRPMCPANTETFSLLFEYNEQRLKWEEYDRLTSLMIGPAQLQPNTFIVNKLLTKELRSRSLGRLWTLYRGLEKEIPPNLETFHLLWRATELHFAGRYESDTAPSKTYVSSRQLFSEMKDWFNGLKTRHARSAKEEFEQDLYTRIIKSFCYQMDLPGTLCAMQGLKQMFDVDPDDVTIRLVTGQVARCLPQSIAKQSPTGGRMRFNHRLASNKSLLRDVAEIFDTLEAKHKIALVESGRAEPDEVEDADSPTAKQMRLDILTELLATIMQRTSKARENYVKTIRDVARTMHVDLDGIKVEVDCS